MKSVEDKHPKVEGRATPASFRALRDTFGEYLRRLRSICSADLQSAVSRIFNPQVLVHPSSGYLRAPADCKLAIQQSSTLCYLVACLLTFSAARAQSLPDATLTQIRFDQKPNAQVSPDLTFVDESGKPVRLGQYFGSKPVVMVLGYYECPMLCTLVLNGFMEGAEDMKWSIGYEFDVVSVSINPSETPALAAAKQRAYVRRYGRAGSAQGWHFLTGNESQIHQLADEVGFRYAYDPASKQYAHPSGIVILTPDGRVSSYLFGVTFPAKDLFAGLQGASVHKVSSPIQQLILLCFHYNPITGKYSGLILIVLRILGALTMLGVLGLIIMLVRRGRAAQASLAAAAQIPSAASELTVSVKSK